MSSRPKTSAWCYGNYITQKGLHLSIVEPIRRRGRGVSVPCGVPLRGWASGQVLQAVTLSVLGLVPRLRGSQAVSQPRWWKRKHGPHCTEAGLRLDSVTGCVLDWELQSPIGCPCRPPLPALVAASALIDLRQWVLPFPDHHSNPKAPR